ncbi:oxysterol-binding protein-related protein 1C-like [Zingiber officinale]|uniref:oxysterol-binding protein-related protein 1C-like n=1 Tax=Zingiber officinale TaxID=94328 RepID=UPI001C4B8AB0|nr:oxysterol-binding protein-related protein 1C-like [Zingiber officinale]
MRPASMAPPPSFSSSSSSSVAVRRDHPHRSASLWASLSVGDRGRPSRRRRDCQSEPSSPSRLFSRNGRLHGDVSLNDIVGNGVSGVLHKWVNYGRGWRPRLFVLQDDVLSYYKIHGPDRIELAPDAKVAYKVIGEESIRRILHPKNGHPHLPCKPVGEVHLKVSSIKESGSDKKRFSIFTGTKRLHLRAATREEREAWMEVLRAVKSMFPRELNRELMAPTDMVVVSTEKLRQRLQQEGLSESAIQDSEQIMRREFASLQNQLLLFKQKQTFLLDTIRQLETEKADLENTLIDDRHKESIEFSSSSIPAHEQFNGNYSPEETASESDDNERHDAVNGKTDQEDITFFDSKDFLSSTSLSCGSDFPRCQIESDDENRYSVSSLDSTTDDSSMMSMGTKCIYIRRRKKLPDPVEKEKSVSLWSIIKDNIGKDLTKVCLPVYFNEPLSSLQKCCEDFEYSYLVDRAYEFGKKGDGLMRILNVAAFAVSGYASTDGRSCKPFNPLLGETYEAEFPEKGLRFFSEKVSHHPAILACHCEGNGWRFWGDSNLKSKFWGRSIQLDPVGVLNLGFDDGEIFQWNKVTTSIYNLILGKLYCDHYGTMRIQGNGEYSCKLKFKEQSIIDRNPHQVQGVVQDRSGKTVATLIGKWDESMHYIMGNGSVKGKGSEGIPEARLLWKQNKPPKHAARYNLTRFAITLNELMPGLKEKLPLTDSRLRPDQRCLENGEYEMANAEKLRLEERQRQARKMQETGWKPRWFAKDKASDAYHYVGGYWESREQGNWQGCIDIFGKNSSDQLVVE